MSWTTRVHVRRALAGPAAAAVLMGAGATATGLLAPQRASALVACPVLTVSPQSYFSTGMEQCFTVPAGVSSIHAVLVGGTGGGGDPFGATPGAGGHGAQVTADVAVTPGEAIYVEAGGAGAVGGDAEGDGGFNGGATGGQGDGTSGGGGGGATDLRTVAATLVACDGGTDFAGGTASLASRILVAGGGGGGGTSASVSDAGGGGDGGAGGMTPGAGATATGGGGGGGAGTPSDGGSGGSKFGTGTKGDHGVSGCGGKGGVGGDRFGLDSGGGGGGGLFGGGGGGGGCQESEGGCVSSDAALPVRSAAATIGGGGGGAGSNFADPTVTSNVAIATDAPAASATISWTAATTPTPTPTATPTASPSPTGSVQGTTTPDTGAGTTLRPGLGLLGVGVVLLSLLAITGRRPRSTDDPRPPA